MPVLQEQFLKNHESYNLARQTRNTNALQYNNQFLQHLYNTGIMPDAFMSIIRSGHNKLDFQAMFKSIIHG